MTLEQFQDALAYVQEGGNGLNLRFYTEYQTFEGRAVAPFSSIIRIEGSDLGRPAALALDAIVAVEQA